LAKQCICHCLSGGYPTSNIGSQRFSAMSLYHLISQSQALAAFSLQELSELLQKSWAYNHAHGLTGILMHAPNGQFLHVLEGEASAVLHLYHNRIALDPRHEHLIVLSQGESATPVFQNWCMSFRAGPELLAQPGYLAPGAACLQASIVSHATPELRRLLLDFAAGYDDSPLYESMMGSRR
jgi:hypothetical protein